VQNDLIFVYFSFQINATQISFLNRKKPTTNVTLYLSQESSQLETCKLKIIEENLNLA
jgi:hypothetical protein